MKILKISLVLVTFLLSSGVAYAIVPNDTDYDELWYVENLGLEEAWDTTTGVRQVIIAVIDTGVDLDHPDLEKNIWTNMGEIPDDGVDNDGNGYVDDANGWDFVDNDHDPSPSINLADGFSPTNMSHGTVVAGVLGAVGNNSEGVTGINWRTRIMPLRVFGSGGSGDTNDAMEAIYYAIYNGADIINLSFVGFGYDSGFEDAIKTAYEAGIVVVAAAGNDDLDLDEEANVTYPVCYQGSEAADWVLGVSASNEDDDKAEFSNYGNDCVDISAPGTGIWGPLYQDDNHGSFHSYYGGYWSGTSVATPMVSGAAALLKAYRPELTVNQIQLALRLGAEALNDNYTDYYHSKIGSGRLNIANALSLAAGFEEVASLVPTGNIYVSIADQPSKVRAFTPGGQQVLELTPFGNDYTGDINISAGDIDGDGQEEIVVAAGDGAPPEVKIFETDGSEVNSFYAYSLEKTTGVWVSTGDVNGDGSDEIITINGEGKATKVKVFEYSGRVLEDFLPFGVGTTNGGRITSGDVDGDGAAEIIVGAGPGLEPRIRVFEYNGELVEQFNAYEESYDKGVLVATADLDGNGIDEIVTGTELGGGPHVRTFSMEGKVLGQFFAYDDLFRGGVRLTSLDTNGDGIDEIVTGAGPHGGPHVRIFDGESNVMGGFFAFIESNHVGINLSGF